MVVVTPSNTNHGLTVRGPAIQLERHRRTVGSCREAVLEALKADGLGPVRNSADVHALLADAGATWSKSTVAKAVFRMIKEGALTRKDGRLVLVS